MCHLIHTYWYKYNSGEVLTKDRIDSLGGVRFNDLYKLWGGEGVKGVRQLYPITSRGYWNNRGGGKVGVGVRGGRMRGKVR